MAVGASGGPGLFGATGGDRRGPDAGDPGVGPALAFREWRARYRERAAFGAGQVATAIDPLAEVVPPGVPPHAWHEAVTDAHAMLVTLTASNLLDLEQMSGLRDEIAAQVAAARPETARDDLARLWDGLAARAGPNVAGRHPYPALLPSPSPSPPHAPPPRPRERIPTPD